MLDALGWKARQSLQKKQKELLKASDGAFFPEAKQDEEYFDEEFTEVHEILPLRLSMPPLTDHGSCPVAACTHRWT